MRQKRLRIFAGPNGSGKSTIFKEVNKRVRCLHYINADIIEEELRSHGMLSFDNFSVLIEEEALKSQFQQSGLFHKTADGQRLCESLKVEKNVLSLSDLSLLDSYFAAFLAEFLRMNMLNIVEEFTIETVMSDPNKLDYIRWTKKMGYRIYLYFVATKNVKINIDRVAFRVENGGHDVPEEKIRKRYLGSLENLFDAVQLSDRAYFFDNSALNIYDKTFFAEYDGATKQIHFQADSYPGWFNDYLLKKAFSAHR
jgi:predicted ABC-type ATPase